MTGKLISGPAYFPIRTTRFGPASTMLAETGQAGPENPVRTSEQICSLFFRTGPSPAGPDQRVNFARCFSGPVTVMPVRKTSEQFLLAVSDRPDWSGRICWSGPA
ncbi:hypothetical protein TIFTF001_009752 [Ficus carica]|uniref:Uncharacterized protein n=1 Tax=Ficus carica TaxID=3494 RepID=A0AA87ZVK2_FICCA|nr:hypothetical protein TIFTF001_009752 [Ficus carica]